MEVLAAVSATIPAVVFLMERASRRIRDSGGNIEAEGSVEELRGLLDTFQAYIRNKEGGVWQDQGCQLTEDFSNKIQDLIFEIEDALDDFMYEAPNKNATTRLTARSKKIMEKRKTITDLYRDLNVGQVSSRSGSMNSAGEFSSSTSFGDQDMVGFEKRRDDLIKQLVEGELSRVTVQAVGPGGSGKTFLVNSIFRSKEIKRSFPDRAWVSLPRRRHFSMKDLVFEILNSFCSRSALERVMDQAGSLEEKLNLYLEDRKFLIVLDNVWNKQDYDFVSDFLPSGLTGSRIIITTRKFGMVDQPGYIHRLEGLTKDESWRLFCREAFVRRRGYKSNNCPQELRELAKRIVERCDGLPLAIVAIARLISKKQQVNVVWDEFYNNIGYEIKRSNDSRLLEHIKPSLVDLSDNLRSCFLYFSMFPEGYSVTRGRLIRSWIAEGFVKRQKGMTLEKVGESYLNELIGLSLVQVCSPEIDERVETCKILRLHHAFIVHEFYGERKNFLSVIDERNPSLPEGKIRRLAVHHFNVAKKLSEINDPSNIRSLFAFGEQEVLQTPQDVDRVNAMRETFRGKSYWKNMFKNVFHRFRLLKVLDLQSMPLHDFPRNIDSFVLLRSVNLRNTKIATIPRSIKKLTLLEFLDVKNTRITELPKWIGELNKLCHLLVSHSSSKSGPQLGVKVNFEIGALSESLHELKLVKAKNCKRFFKKLGKLGELRKLGLVDLKTQNGHELCRSIQKMKNLSTLDVASIAGEYLDLDHDMKLIPIDIQCLRLTGRLYHRLPRWTSSLRSLVKVVLKCSKLRSNVNPLESLEDFQSLLELKLVDYCTGERLVFKANTFKKLKKLHLERFDQLTEVVFEKNSMPILEKLTICVCQHLNKFPIGLCLGKLEEFVAYEMSNDFLDDAETTIYNASSLSSHDGRGMRRIESRRYMS